MERSSSQKVAREICEKDGHTITSLVYEEKLTSNNSTVLREYAIICIKCGMGLDEILGLSKEEGDETTSCINNAKIS